MRLYNLTMMKFVTLIISISFLASCNLPDNLGFLQPITLRVTIPEGPPAYKAGWYAGCRSGLSIKRFANSTIFQDENGVYFGNGVYQHDPVFQSGWSHGWFSCIIHTGTLDGIPSFGPLE